jgi:hypothetical protein
VRASQNRCVVNHACTVMIERDVGEQEKCPVPTKTAFQ